METIVKEKARILYINDNTLFAHIGNKLWTSDDLGESWLEHPLKLSDGACAYSRIHARLTRIGVHCARILRDGNILLVVKQAIYVYGHQKRDLIKSFSIPRGSRPLFVCENHNGDLFWGEYFSNPERDEVNVYVSRDLGKSWEIAYRFKKDSIRHVHGVFCDPYDDRIWLTTGDEDHESAIWVTDDRFKNLERVIGGSQQSRALQLLFTNDYVYFGTDTPFELNHIYRLDKGTGRTEELTSVDSSIYWGCKVGDYLFFSTTVEPSRVNVSNFACIWGSRDGSTWKQIAKYKKDFWPSRYFQIGQIYFPGGNNSTGHLFYTPIAAEGDQTIQRVNVAELDNSSLI